jgi:hybrid polyketide synthase / nonribosomal peptide synthetase ACE1
MIFVSQAVDERILFQRSPLSYGSSLRCISPGPLIEELVIVGGCTLKTSILVEQIKLLLKQYCGVARAARSLVELQSLPVSTATTVLSMVELDRQLFTHISEPGQWESLKLLLQWTRGLFWVSRERRSESGRSNMTVGLLRAVAHEIPGFHVQSLDIEDPNSLDARVIAETVLRFKSEILWQRCDPITQYDNATLERELVIEKSGRTVIPRLVINKDMNDR